MKPWLLPAMERVAFWLNWSSPFWLLEKASRRLLKRDLASPGAVEVWCVANVALSLAAVYLTSSVLPRPWAVALGAYGVWRVWDILLYQVNALLFDQARGGKHYALESYRRMLVLLLGNVLEVVAWFASVLALLGTDAGVGAGLGSLFAASFAVLTGFGPGTVDPKSSLALVVVWTESAIGLFMLVAVLARFISLLPVPRTRDQAEVSDDD